MLRSEYSTFPVPPVPIKTKRTVDVWLSNGATLPMRLRPDVEYDSLIEKLRKAAELLKVANSENLELFAVDLETQDPIGCLADSELTPFETDRQLRKENLEFGYKLLVRVEAPSETSEASSHEQRETFSRSSRSSSRSSSASSPRPVTSSSSSSSSYSSSESSSRSRRRRSKKAKRSNGHFRQEEKKKRGRPRKKNDKSSSERSGSSSSESSADSGSRDAKKRRHRNKSGESESKVVSSSRKAEKNKQHKSKKKRSPAPSLSSSSASSSNEPRSKHSKKSKTRTGKNESVRSKGKHDREQRTSSRSDAKGTPTSRSDAKSTPSRSSAKSTPSRSSAKSTPSRSDAKDTTTRKTRKERADSSPSSSSSSSHSSSSSASSLSSPAPVSSSSKEDETADDVALLPLMIPTAAPVESRKDPSSGWSAGASLQVVAGKANGSAGDYYLPLESSASAAQKHGGTEKRSGEHRDESSLDESSSSSSSSATSVYSDDDKPDVPIEEEPFVFGLSGLSSPVPMGVGTWSWGNADIWQFGTSKFGKSQCHEAFDEALLCGISFFDTAEVYGEGLSEELLGDFIDDREPGEMPRAIVATKYMPYMSHWRASNLRSQLLKSMDRLGVRKIDLYQIHGLMSSVRSAEAWAAALADVVNEGLVKAVGVSNYTADQVQRTHSVLANHGVALASNQVEYSLVRRAPEFSGLITACRELGVTVIAYSPLAMGRLTGKYSVKFPCPSSRVFGNVKQENVDKIVEALRDIGQRHGGKTPSQVALNWIICKGCFPIAGAKSAEQVRENAGALGWRLRKKEISILDKLSIHCQAEPGSFFLRLWQD